MQAPDPDKAALIAILQRDERAFAEFVEHRSEHLTASVTKWTSGHASSADVEEILQDVWYDVWTHACKHDQNQPFMAWVYMLASSRAKNFVRREARRRKLVKGFDADVVQATTSQHARGEARISGLIAVVASVLATLPANERTVCEAYYLDGMTQAEIAALLQQSRSTVQRVVGRTREQIAHALAD
jgi:RNA polymerase sigma-70 factor, ECF subfamily